MNLYLNVVAFLLLERLVRCQVHFDCPQLPPLTQPARTVHELRPQDIKVIMTLGDSVTAGKIHVQLNSKTSIDLAAHETRLLGDKVRC